MDKMIKEIYNGVVRGSGYMAGADKRIQEEIEKLFQEEKNKTDWREYETYRDKIFSAVGVAEEYGFVQGFKYAVMLLKECLLD